MIKINLLPTKKKAPKKVIDLQQQMILAVLILILLGIGLGYYWLLQSRTIASLKEEKAAKEALIRQQLNDLKAVESIGKSREEVKKKIDIIETLKKNQAGPVRLLDELAMAIPKGVMVNSLVERNNHIDLNGEAFTNDDIVKFVDHLKASRFLANVNLLETSLAGSKGGVTTYKYRLEFLYKGI
jgi:type IV pilus assembly protein PilN